MSAIFSHNTSFAAAQAKIGTLINGILIDQTEARSGGGPYDGILIDHAEASDPSFTHSTPQSCKHSRIYPFSGRPEPKSSASDVA